MTAASPSVAPTTTPSTALASGARTLTEAHRLAAQALASVAERMVAVLTSLIVFLLLNKLLPRF